MKRMKRWLKDLWTGTYFKSPRFWVFNEWGVWPLPVIGFLRGGYFLSWHRLRGGMSWRHNFKDSAVPCSGAYCYTAEDGWIDPNAK